MRRRPPYKRKYKRRFPLVTPQTHFVKLKYIDMDTTSINLVGTPYGYQYYNINNPHDVNAATATRTMPGFSEWKAIYRRFRVMATKMKTTFYNGVEGNWIVGMGMDKNNPDALPWGALSVWQNLRSFEGNPNWRFSHLGWADGGRGTVTLSLYRKPWQVWGDKKEYEASGQFSANTNANTPTNMRGYITVQTMNSGNATTIIECKTEITMWIKFYERQNFFASLIGDSGEAEVGDPDDKVPQFGTQVDP